LEQLLLPTESEEVKKEMRKAGGDSMNSRKRSRHCQPAAAADEESPAPKLRCVDFSGDGLADQSDTQGTERTTAAADADCVGYGDSSVTGELLVRYPIDVVSHREGIHKCDIAGKQSLSGFR
jgi:hypothetical protein